MAFGFGVVACLLSVEDNPMGKDESFVAVRGRDLRHPPQPERRERFMNLTPTPEKVWLFRGVFLAVLVLFWLGYASACENWRVTEDLLARGKTTVAKPRGGDLWERLKPEESVIRLKGRAPVLKRKKTYSYEVEGRHYEDYTTGEADPVRQTITYLPEDPRVHRLGVIQPQSLARKLGGAAMMFVFLVLPTFGFFTCCVVTPGNPYPTRLGWWLILGFSAAQIALVLTMIFLVRKPALVILALYVPTFVGGTIAATLCVRFFAWRWNIKLSNLTEVIESEGKRGHRRFS